jgi:sugar phosphate isomerase/epimerase
MNRLDRREFLGAGMAGLAVAATGPVTSLLRANPLGLPIGLALYTVRDQMRQDFRGTLAQVAAIGYQEVEISPWPKLSPSELKQAVDAAGLKAPAGHTDAQHLKDDVAPLIDTFKQAGLQYMICSFPATRPGAAHPVTRTPGQRFDPSFGEDDYKWMAETFNQVGEKCQKVGLQFGYHCHNLDFKVFDGRPALDMLLADTDPKLVQLEMDCYWVLRAGKDPVDYMKRYPGRIPILHVKDMKPGLTPTTSITEGGGEGFTEVGRGWIDWKHIFQAGPEGGVKHYFVEQDKCSGPPMESAKISYEYLKNLQV